MLAYVLRRLLLIVPTLIGITFVTFCVVQLAPGDPAQVELLGGAEGTAGVDVQAALSRFRRELLLDRPLWEQYLHYVGPFDLSERGHRWFGGSGEHPFGGLVLGDFRREILRPEVEIGDELVRRLAVTVPLTLIAVLLAYALALPLGILAAVKRGSPFDSISVVLVFLLYSVPTFWAGLMLQLAFGRTGLGWLPVLGLHDPEAATFSRAESAWDVVRHAILPIACLTYGGFAYLSRQMRAGMLETIGQDYVRTARAKGLAERTVVLKHALRNSLIPVVTLFATVLPALIGGSVIVETIFDVPGMGRYAVEGLLQRDYFVVMATSTLSAVMTCLGILVSDLAYAWLDPRIRYE